MSAPRELRYPRRALLGDYLRAGVGLAVTLPPLAVAEAGAVGYAVLGGLAALFLYLLGHTAARHRTRVRLGPDGIAAGRVRLPWDRVRRVRLKFFGRRRAGPAGFMQLRLIGDGGRITVESGLEDFLDVARAAHRAVRANGIALDPASAENFRALGFAAPREEERAT